MFAALRFAAVLLAAAPLLLAAKAQPTPARRGEALAERLCARCHAIGRVGDSPFAPAPPFREVMRRYPAEDLAEAFAEGIVTGHPAMPTFELQPAEIDALIAYLKTLGPAA